MNREGHNNIDFFVGYEVERTPAYGMKTLFVVGVQSIDDTLIKYKHEQCQHIFFGANHSFDPVGSDWEKWEVMITHFLHKGILCTLDIPIAVAEDFLESCLIEHHNFIPQLRVPLPYIQQWNYNTMIKLDDKDFAATNPGVWCHNLHDLMDRSKYTDWNEYTDDETIHDR
jgi:hypothetical protein